LAPNLVPYRQMGH